MFTFSMNHHHILILSKDEYSKIIQKLSLTKRVIVIEHDLAVLDVLADLVHIVYGKKGAFGVFTLLEQLDKQLTHI